MAVSLLTAMATVEQETAEVGRRTAVAIFLEGCITTASGAIACGIVTDTYLAAFFDCPATLSGPEDCQSCDVVSLVGDILRYVRESIVSCLFCFLNLPLFFVADTSG